MFSWDKIKSDLEPGSRKMLGRLEEVNTTLRDRRKSALEFYVPYGPQEEFHYSDCMERLLRGGVRSGKSVCAAAEFTAAFLGLPILDSTGKQIPDKWSRQWNLVLWVIGYGEKHIGQTFYRLLFKKGAFDIIKDEETKKWRTFKPWDARDMAREKERRPAPPFIDPTEKGPHILKWAWKKPSAKLFEAFYGQNGNAVYAYTSKGEPKEGDPVDGIWIDENIAHFEHYAEWQSRTTDRRGKIWWSAWPKTKNRALRDVSTRARLEFEHKAENPTVKEFRLTMSGNPYVPSDIKAQKRQAWGSDQERRARDDGDWVTDSILVYPSFSPHVHAIMPGWQPGCDEEALDKRNWRKIDHAVFDNGRQIPSNWTRYLAIDPGHSQAAVVFAAVPPPDLGDHVVIYDELYPRHADASAENIAQAILNKVQGHYFQKFIIDHHAGRQTQLAAGRTNRDDFAAAFEKRNIMSVETGFSFAWGIDNVNYRVQKVRTWLDIRQDGGTKLLFMVHNIPNMQREFDLYEKKVSQDFVTEEVIAKYNDAMNCLEYLVAANPSYHTPTKMPEPEDPVFLHYKDFLEQRKAGRNDDYSSDLGPSRIAM